MGKIDLKSMTFDEIEKYMESKGYQKYRAKQVFQWLYKGKKFNEMTNLPKDLISLLKEETRDFNVKIFKKYKSNIDNTIKYLYELVDMNIIETVIMSYKHGNTACISTQVGCRMGCDFCASTLNGLVRNLSTAEMVDQIVYSQKEMDERISNVVLMGIGEPFDNYDNIIKLFKIINEDEGLKIGYRKITVSTCGISPKIIEFTKEDIPVNLAVSLHAPNNKIRDKIMPINRKYNIESVLSACREYSIKSNRRITFEYSMISGLNDSLDNAKELAYKIKDILCHVNLIPVNKIDEKNFKGSLRKNVEAFKIELEKHRIPTTIRRKLGYDISASCGQLRKKNTQEYDL